MLEIRLHQNENTNGCSPAVMAALGALTAVELARYPTFDNAVARCARYFGVPPEWVFLTNGLDEGILALAVAARGTTAGPVEVLVPEPAFPVFRASTIAVGARLVQVMPGPGLTVAVDGVLAGISPRTRLVFLANPANPTGLLVSTATILRIAAALPPGALMLVDEAYAEFAGVTLIPSLASLPNVVIGRTFSKAFGLAGLRIGCLIGHPETLAAVRTAVPIFNVNVPAVVALEAALGDLEYAKWFIGEVAASKHLVYAACDRWSLPYWPSAASFVLIDCGEQASDCVAAAARRQIYVRDRSDQPGCAGCVRVSLSTTEHTSKFVDFLDEFMTTARRCPCVASRSLIGGDTSASLAR